MVPQIQGIWKCTGSEPSMGSLLPCVPTYFTPAATTDKSRAAVCQPETPDVPRP